MSHGGRRAAASLLTLDGPAQDFLTAAGITDPTISSAVQGLVDDLVGTGLWDKMSAIWPFVGGTASTHKFNLKDPRDADDAYRLTFNSGGDHSTTLGYIPNAIGNVANGGYADTHFIPRDHLTQNSTHLAFYSTRDTTPISECEMGNYAWDGDSAKRFHLIIRYSNNAFYYGMSESGGTNVSSTDARGLFVGTRTASNLQAAYRNGAQLGTNSGASVALPNNTTWIGGINSFQDRTDRSCGFASIGSGLDETDNANLYTTVQAFQTALGRQV